MSVTYITPQEYEAITKRLTLVRMLTKLGKSDGLSLKEKLAIKAAAKAIYVVTLQNGEDQ
jgi:hypothetical protein